MGIVRRVPISAEILEAYRALAARKQEADQAEDQNITKWRKLDD